MPAEALFMSKGNIVTASPLLRETTIMDIQQINTYKSAFDEIMHNVNGDDGSNIEVWYARELQHVLGYARWENFAVAIGRAMQSCKTQGINIDDHFREVTKMVSKRRLVRQPAAPANPGMGGMY